MPALHIHNQSDLSFSQQRVAYLIETTLAQQAASLTDITVSFVPEDVITRLNQQHRGRTGPTDVLSYPYDASFPQGSGGEIVVCPAVMKGNAKCLGQRVETELDTVIVHAMLHLLGHTDDTAEDRAEMDRLTKEILGVAGGQRL